MIHPSINKSTVSNRSTHRSTQLIHPPNPAHRSTMRDEQTHRWSLVAPPIWNPPEQTHSKNIITGATNDPPTDQQIYRFKPIHPPINPTDPPTKPSSTINNTHHTHAVTHESNTGPTTQPRPKHRTQNPTTTQTLDPREKEERAEAAFGSVERKEQRRRKQRTEGRERRSLGGEKNTEGIKYIYFLTFCYSTILCL